MDDGQAAVGERTSPDRRAVRRDINDIVPRAVAAIAAIAVLIAGVIWGTHVAGGPDSYCYLSQAELFAAGHVVDVEPLARLAPWEHGAEAFVPVGHVPAARVAGASVPMCSPGYPIAMAAARHLGGRPAMFAVVPLCGAIAVWLTFMLGRRVAGAHTGAIAAVLLAASPPFLYQVVQPMSDVPAAAAWAAALFTVTHDRFATSWGRAVLGGVATGAALLVRPNGAARGCCRLRDLDHPAARLPCLGANMARIRRRIASVRTHRRSSAERDVWRPLQVGLWRSELPV
jgi:asparagine N-glycosylation enzyme membrane subunit Stt3